MYIQSAQHAISGDVTIILTEVCLAILIDWKRCPKRRGQIREQYKVKEYICFSNKKNKQTKTLNPEPSLDNFMKRKNRKGVLIFHSCVNINLHLSSINSETTSKIHVNMYAFRIIEAIG